MSTSCSGTCTASGTGSVSGSSCFSSSDSPQPGRPAQPQQPPPPAYENLDCEIFFDLSSSMGKPAKKGDIRGQTRLEHGEEATIDIVKDFCERDRDGIVMGSYNRTYEVKNIRTLDDARAYLETLPDKLRSGTRLAPLLKDRFNDFKVKYARNKTRRVIVIVTDGATKDFPDVVKEIRDMANWKGLSSHKDLGVFFLVTGDSKSGLQLCQALDCDAVQPDGSDRCLWGLDDNKAVPPFKHDLVDAKTVAWMEEENRTIADLIQQAFDD